MLNHSSSNLRWSSQHEMLEKLNMQAILSASSNETEYVKDSIITFEKVKNNLLFRSTVEIYKFCQSRIMV